ncbi:T cell receptor alpha chain MC.7.G5-like, partial [Antennarius striatus]|uniref:T cell receptor alpha chain MC.7.G5-like n=1 Tax=Antennarius striatus TaxID=241820 RepID=UPI0035AEC182
MEHWLWMILAALFFECKGEDKVIQTTGDVIAPEGASVTLDCKYFSSDTRPNLLWYKQDGNNGPKFMLSRYKLDEGNTEAEFRERFSSRLNSSSRSVPLKIQNLQPSDSAVYYCVLRPTVTGNTRTLVVSNSGAPKGPGFSCEELTPVQKEQSGSEDTTVTLSYKYHKPATGADVFFWYQQYPGKPPEFLMSHLGTQNKSQSRLLAAVSVDQTQMDLQISSAAVTDSALFYCAVR